MTEETKDLKAQVLASLRKKPATVAALAIRLFSRTTARENEDDVRNMLIHLVDAGAVEQQGLTYMALSIEKIALKQAARKRYEENAVINTASLKTLEAFFERSAFSTELVEEFRREAYEIWDRWNDFKMERDNLRSGIKRLADNLVRVVAYLALEQSIQYDGVSSSGEIQGRGPEIDVHCALLEQKRAELLRAIYHASEQFRAELLRAIKEAKC